MALNTTRDKLFSIAAGMGSGTTEKVVTREELKERALKRKKAAETRAQLQAVALKRKAQAEAAARQANNEYLQNLESVERADKTITGMENAYREYVQKNTPSLPVDKATRENTAYSHDSVPELNVLTNELDKMYRSQENARQQMGAYETENPEAVSSTRKILEMLAAPEVVNPFDDAATLREKQAQHEATAAGYAEGSWEKKTRGALSTATAEEMGRQAGIIENPIKALEQVNGTIAQLEETKAQGGYWAEDGEKKMDRALASYKRQKALLEASIAASKNSDAAEMDAVQRKNLAMASGEYNDDMVAYAQGVIQEEDGKTNAGLAAIAQSDPDSMSGQMRSGLYKIALENGYEPGKKYEEGTAESGSLISRLKKSQTEYSAEEMMAAARYKQPDMTVEEALALIDHKEGAFGTTDYSKILMTTAERAAYDDLVAAGETEKAEAYMEALRPILADRKTAADVQGYRGMTEAMPITANIFARGANVLNGISSTYTHVQQIRGAEIDPNSPFFAGDRMRQTVTQKSREMIGDAIENETLGKAAQGAYDTAVAIMDSAISLLTSRALGLGPKMSAALMAYGTVGDNVRTALEEGASQGEAYALALAGMATEYATEVIPTSVFMRSMDGLGDKGLVKVLKGMLDAVFSDGLGEGVNTVVAEKMDEIIRDNNSNIARQVNNYLVNGVTDVEEAYRLAWRDTLQSAGYDAMIGALSAGLLEGGIDLVNTAGRRAADRNTAREEEVAMAQGMQQPAATKDETEQPAAATQQAPTLADIAAEMYPVQQEKPAASVTVQTAQEVRAAQPAEKTQAQKDADAAKTARAQAKRRAAGLTVQGTEDGYAVEKDGQTANLDDLGADDVDVRMLANAEGMTAEAANDMLSLYDDKGEQSAVDFGKGYKQAYEAGLKGTTFEDTGKLFAGDMTQAQRRSAWEMGQKARNEANARIEHLTRRNAARNGFHARSTEDGVSFENVQSNITAEEKTTLSLLDAFGKRWGLNIRIYDTLAGGKANASYLAGSNVVNIARDAEGGALVRAASHEVYHYLEQFSKEDAAKIRAFVLEKLGGNEEFDLDGEREKYRARYENVEGADVDAEIVADSLLDVIGTEENIRAMAKDSPNLLSRIVEVVKRMRDYLRGQLERLSGNSEVVAMMLEDEAALAQVQRMAEEGLANAKANRDAQQRVGQLARQDAAVQSYMQLLQDAENADDRAYLLESLVKETYERTQSSMLQNTGDYDGGLAAFKDALRAFANNEGQLSWLLQTYGLDQAQSAQDNAVMAFVGRELKQVDEAGVKSDGTVKYSLNEFGFEDFDKESKNNILQRGGIIVKTRNELVQNIIEALEDAEKKKYMYLGAIKESTKERIEKDIGMQMFKNGQYSYAVSYDDIRHIRPHYRTVDELADAIEQVYGVTNGYDSVQYEKEKTGQERLIFKKTYPTRETLAVEMVSKRNRSFDLVTIYDTKGNKKRDQAGVTDTSNGTGAPRYGSVSDESVTDNEGSVNEKLSLKAEPEKQYSQKDTDNMNFFAEISTDEEVREAGKLINRLHEMRKEAKVQQGAWSGKTTDVSKKILADTNSSMNQAALTRKINTMYKAMDAGDATPRQLMEYAYAIAEKVAEGAGQVQELGEGEREAREYIRNTRIYLDADMQSEVRAVYGSLRAYMNRNFGKARFTTDSKATSLEEMWGELHKMAPGYFKEDTANSEMPMVLEGFLEATGKVARDYFGASEEQLTQDVAMRLFWEYYSMPGTYGDLKAQEKEMVERIADLQEGLRDTFEQRVQEKVENYKAGEEKQRQRAMLERNVKAMTKRLMKPTKSQHIPEEMRGTVAKMLELVNTGGNKRSQQKRTEAYNELLGMIAKLRETDTGLAYVDPDMEAYIEELRNNAAGKSVMSMSLDELKDLNRVVTGIRHACTVSDQLLTAGHKGSVAAIADDARRALDTMKDRKVRGDLVRSAINVGKYAMEDAPRFFQDLARYTGKAGKNLWDIVRHGGLDKQIRLLKEAEERVNGIHQKYKGYEKWMSRNSENHTFQTESGAINLTTGQVMALYLLNKRPQARNHIYGIKGTDGGIAQGRVNTKNGASESTRPSSVTEEQVEKIIGSLSAEQKALADEMGKLLSGWCADLGNEVSMDMYGYRKFTEENYFPIQVWGGRKDATSGEDRQNQLYLVMNKGFTKEVQDKAQAPLVIPDMFDAVTEHVNGMIVYNAWTAPVTDMIKFINYKFRDDSMTVDQNGNEVFAPGQNIIGTVKEDLSRVMGNGAEKWYVQLIEDINGLAKNRVEKDVTGFVNKLTRNYKAAAVGWNIGTMLKQPTSVIRAFDVIPPMYFAGKPVVPNKQRQAIMEKYAPIVTWKGYGNFTMDTGKSIERILFPESTTKMERFNEWGMAGAGYMDTVTWHNIWAAAERMTAKKNKDMQRGTDAFYKKTAEIFNQCIDQTQTVDSILHRSQMMRQDTAWIKSVTAFMGEPIKAYNMLLDAVNDWKTTNTKERARKVSKTAGVFVVSAMTTAFVNSLVGTLFNWDDEDPFWQQVWQRMFGNYTEDMTSWQKFKEAAFNSELISELNILNYIPVARDVMESLAGHDVERIDMSLVADTVDAMVALGSEKTATPEKIMNMAAKLSNLLNLQAGSLWREAKRMWNWGNQQLEAFGVNTLESQYAYLKTQKNIGATANIGEYADLLLKAEAEGDTELAAKIRKDMVDAGIDEADIDSKTYKLQVEDLTGIKNASYEKTYAALGQAIRAGDEQLVKELTKALKRAGRTDEQIETGLVNWLKEDPRVISAAEKAVRGDTSEKAKLAKTLREEGFSDATGKKAINQLQNKMVSDSKKETAPEEESKEPEYEALYTYYDLQMAIEDGDDVSEIMEDLRKQGKEDSSIKSGLTSRIKPVYIALMNGTASDKAKARKIREHLLQLDLKNKYTEEAIDKWLKE